MGPMATGSFKTGSEGLMVRVATCSTYLYFDRYDEILYKLLYKSLA